MGMVFDPDVGAEPFSETHLDIVSEDDVVAARGAAREVAKLLQFGLVDQSRIATAVSELTRNVIRYANPGTGEVMIRALPVSPRGVLGIEIIVRDGGPGIADIDQALTEGFTSGAGMGMGLPGTKRLMDEMEMTSGVGRGTTVTIRKWHR
jgi:serine/threonine-protein kinase RsbT